MVLNYKEFLNEALMVSANFVRDNIIKNKNNILTAIKEKDTIKLVNHLTKIFDSKFKFEEKTILDIEKLSKDLYDQMDYILKKIEKYPEIRPYLKQEYDFVQDLHLFISSKKKEYIEIKFQTFNQYKEYEKRNLIGKFFVWIEKLITPTLKHYVYNKSKVFGVEQYSFGIYSLYYDLFTNSFGVVVKNDFGNKITPNNIYKFADHLMINMKHELIHQKDYINKTVEVFKNNDMYAFYHDKRTELKAFAGECVESFRTNKFDDSLIKRILLTPTKYFKERNASEAFIIYFGSYYEENRLLYYNFVSECLDYLDEKEEVYK